MKYRELGDVPYEVWLRELERVGSPLLPYSMAMYDVLRGHTALALAQMWQESQYETDRDLLRFTDYNPFNMKEWPEDPRGMWGIGAIGTKPTGVGGPDYLTFESPIRAAQEWRRRVIDDPSYKGGVYNADMTLEEYIETFAPSYEKHPTTGEDNSSYPANVVTMLKRYGAWKEDDPVAKHKIHVVLVAGHNSVGDGGNPVERALTPDLARAYLAAFKAAGISAEWINPTLTPGGLTALALLTARKIQEADADLVLALDLHYNGSNSGVHVIPPHNRKANGGQLASGFVQGRVAEDVMENNTLDVRLAGAYAKAIVAAVDGMYLWGSNGIMPESQTGVGLAGSRLGMMGASAPYRDKAVRLTIEHGGTNDAKRPNFAAKCAAAVVATTKVVLADRLESGQPHPDPETPPTGDPGSPTLPEFLFGAVGQYSFDPNGPISQLWLKNANETGSFPRLIDVQEGKPKYFVFSDGSVIVDNAGKLDYLLKV